MDDETMTSEPIWTVRVDGRTIEIGEQHITGRELRQRAGLKRGRYLLHQVGTRLVPVRNADSIARAQDAIFFTYSAKAGDFFAFNVNSIGSIIAVLISIASFVYSAMSVGQTSAHDAIRNLYTVYYDISKTELEIPQALHVFMLPGAYEEVAKEVHKAVAHATDSDLAKYRLSERAMADYLFSVFEANLIDYQSSSPLQEPMRRKFEEGVLDFFTQKLLRNPRLLYYWSRDGGKLSEEYQDTTQQYYNEHVLSSANRKLIEAPDPVGPLTN
jgi:hypothetical protein